MTLPPARTRGRAGQGGRTSCMDHTSLAGRGPALLGVMMLIGMAVSGSILLAVVLAGTAAFAQTRIHSGFSPAQHRPGHRFAFGGLPLFAGDYDYAPAPSM